MKLSKIKNRVKNTVKLLVKNDEFLINFIKPFLFDYINYVRGFYTQNKEKINKLDKTLSLKVVNKDSNIDFDEVLLIYSKLLFLVDIVKGFDLNNNIINTDYLKKHFSIVSKEEKNKFNEDLKKASNYFESLCIESNKKILEYRDLYEKGNFLLNYALNEKDRIRILEDFVSDDITNNIVKEIKEKNSPIISEQISKNNSRNNYINL